MGGGHAVGKGRRAKVEEGAASFMSTREGTEGHDGVEGVRGGTGRPGQCNRDHGDRRRVALGRQRRLCTECDW